MTLPIWAIVVDGLLLMVIGGEVGWMACRYFEAAPLHKLIKRAIAMNDALILANRDLVARVNQMLKDGEFINDYNKIVTKRPE